MELMPGYKQTDVGVIPEDWELISIGKAGQVLGGRQRSPHYVGPLCKYLRVANVFDGFLKTEDVLEMPFSPAEKERFLLKVGDILLNEGQSIELVGRGAIYRGIPNDCCFQNTLLRFRSNRGTCREFAQVVFQRYRRLGVFASIASQTTSIAHLGAGRFAALQMPAPPLPEQRAIAKALSDADALIESIEQLIAKKRDLKRGAMQELLTGRKRLPGFSGKWSPGTIGSLAILSNVGSTPATYPELLFAHFSLPAYDAGAIPVSELGGLIESNKFIVLAGAVLVSKLNPRIPRVWAPSPIPENAVCSTEFLVLIPRETTDRGFLAALCLSQEFCYQMKLHAIGTTGSHQRIHPSQVIAIEVTVPSLKAEQIAIATVLADMDAEIVALETKLAKVSQLKQGMMQNLLTGKIRLI